MYYSHYRIVVVAVVAVGSITSRCSGKEPALLPRTRQERAAEIEPIVAVVVVVVVVVLVYIIAVVSVRIGIDRHMLGLQLIAASEGNSVFTCYSAVIM